MKNPKGITLIALVITIIVLLILAGVSIALVAGNNGILGRTKNAVNTNELAIAKEELNNVCSDAQMSFYDAWGDSRNANLLYYFAKPSVYALNCQKAKMVCRATKIEDANEYIYIKYTTQSDLVYYFRITIASDDSFTLDNLPSDLITDQNDYKVVKGKDAITDADYNDISIQK